MDVKGRVAGDRRPLPTHAAFSHPLSERMLFASSLSRNWMECPNYTATVPNECYFNKSYTSIWTSYCLQLRSRHRNVTYDERCFNVEDIGECGSLWRAARHGA